MEDFPETPAHVFAYRAFRTALFGTPVATQDDDFIHRDGHPADYQIQEPNTHIEQSLAKIVKADPKTCAGSPIKSILLTPGTIAQQRKTVTFSGVRDDGNGITGSRTRGQEKKQISRKQSFDDLMKPKDTVRRSLFQSPSDSEIRPKLLENHAPSDAIEPSIAILAKSNAQPAIQPEIASTTDTTMDLKSPKSQSGKHWKNEYQREHDRTKAEMKRLIRYSQVAKSFAAKRDAEASRMREKLEDADRKVKQLEEKVTQLATELGNVQLEDNHHPDLMEDLAIQTANALKYRQKAERYRAALQNEGNLPAIDLDVAMGLHPQEKGRDAVMPSSEPQPSTEHKSRITTLEAENEVLRNTIARVKEEMQRYEERHRDWEENRRRRDERWATKRRDLEDQLKQSRDENTQLRADLHDARLGFSQIEGRSKPPSSNGPMQPSLQEVAPPPKQIHQSAPTRMKPESRQAKEVLAKGKVQDAVEKATSSEVELGSLRSNLQSSKRLNASIKAKSPTGDIQNETLDLWGLAASTDNIKQRLDPDLLPIASSRFRRPYNVTVENPQVADESLWDNLKRRTSMSLMSNTADIKLDQMNGVMKVGKENIQPALLPQP